MQAFPIRSLFHSCTKVCRVTNGLSLIDFASPSLGRSEPICRAFVVLSARRSWTDVEKSRWLPYSFTIENYALSGFFARICRVFFSLIWFRGAVKSKQSVYLSRYTPHRHTHSISPRTHTHIRTDTHTHTRHASEFSLTESAHGGERFINAAIQ